MAHFAELDDNQVVLRVIVVDNDNEDDGETWCKNLLGGIAWKQTSYNKKFRKNYAGIGFTYDPDKDVFLPPKPFSKWVLDETKWVWKAPTDYPDDGKFYSWNDNKGEWEEVSE